MIEYILLSAFCAACISYTITVAGIFKAFRDWIGSKCGDWVDELVHCPYCFGHYVVLTIMLTTRDVKEFFLDVTSSTLYNFLFTWFAIVGVMSVIHFIMVRTYAPIAELEAFRKIKKNKLSFVFVKYSI